MARPSMAEISGTALVGGTELAQALAQALGEGAAESQNMDVGAIAVQDTSGTASRMEDEGLISQGTPGGFQSSTYSDSVKREPGESFMDYTTRMNREMYPGHYEAAQAYGATGLNAFGQKHKDFIENNKSQMRAMGIQPSHKNNAGQLTGRYSSNDWKAFQSALAGGTMATEQLDDETITMEDSVARDAASPSYTSPYPGDPNRTQTPGLYPNQIGITPPQGHPDWGLSGVAPNQGPYTSFDPEAAAMGMPAPLGGGASPYVDDFSAYGQQVQPGVSPQIDNFAGMPTVAPGAMTGPEQFTNFTAATTPMSGVQMTAPGQNTVGAPGASWGDYGAPTGGVTNDLSAASTLIEGGNKLAPGYYEDMSTEVDSFRNLPATSPGITSPITGPEQFGGYQRGVAQGYPFAGPQMTAPGQSTSPYTSDYSGQWPEEQASQYSALPATGAPGHVEDIRAQIDSFRNLRGEMDEGTLDPNAGLISRGTQAFDAGVDQAQSLYPNQIGVGPTMDTLMDQAMPIAQKGNQLMRGLTPTVIESVTESIQTIADKPIADGTDAPELIKNNVSSGGSHESRVEDLVKAGVPQTLTNLMEDSAVAMLHFALTQLVAQYPNEKITFNDLVPYIQKMNLSAGGNQLSTFSDSDVAAGVQAEKDFEIGKGK